MRVFSGWQTALWGWLVASFSAKGEAPGASATASVRDEVKRAAQRSAAGALENATEGSWFSGCFGKRTRPPATKRVTSSPGASRAIFTATSRAGTVATSIATGSVVVRKPAKLACSSQSSHWAKGWGATSRIRFGRTAREVDRPRLARRRAQG